MYSKRMQRCAVIWQEDRCRRLNTVKADRIQGDSGGKVSVLGGDSIGHCEENVYMNVCTFEWLPKWSWLNIQAKLLITQT